MSKISFDMKTNYFSQITLNLREASGMKTFSGIMKAHNSISINGVLFSLTIFVQLWWTVVLKFWAGCLVLTVNKSMPLKCM